MPDCFLQAVPTLSKGTCWFDQGSGDSDWCTTVQQLCQLRHGAAALAAEDLCVRGNHVLHGSVVMSVAA